MRWESSVFLFWEQIIIKRHLSLYLNPLIFIVLFVYYRQVLPFLHVPSWPMRFMRINASYVPSLRLCLILMTAARVQMHVGWHNTMTRPYYVIRYWLASLHVAYTIWILYRHGSAIASAAQGCWVTVIRAIDIRPTGAGTLSLSHG